MRSSRSSFSSIRSSGSSTASAPPAASSSPRATASPSPRGSNCSTSWMVASCSGRRIAASAASSCLATRAASSSGWGAKYSAIARLASLTTRITSFSPLRAASATTYSSAGVLTIGSSSLGTTFVTGKNRVPLPAAGIRAVVTRLPCMPGRLTAWERRTRQSYARSCSRRAPGLPPSGSLRRAPRYARTFWTVSAVPARLPPTVHCVPSQDHSSCSTPWRTGGALSVDAIAAVDLVLAPALAVSEGGVRLGRGGGSYDRALARVPSGVPIWALIYDDELVDELPRDDWDIPVTGAITPSGWHDLRP